jgi:predicted nucleic acid-binding protein
LRLAYIDSSYFIAIAVGEPGYRDLLVRLAREDEVYSSHLLEAELRSALARHGESGKIRNFLSWIDWVAPSRPLTKEIDQILSMGYLKGPDLWHLACALFLRSKVPNLSFLTLDRNQGELARLLGFPGFRPPRPAGG